MTRDIASELVGAWRLVSYSAVTPGGETLYPMGPNVRGRILYDAAGRMAVQIGDPDRAAFAAAVPGAAVPGAADPAAAAPGAADSEVRAASDGYLAYFGAYTVDAARGVVVHHPEMSLNPNWIGVDQVRYFDLQGDRLTLKTPPVLVGGVEGMGTLVWERLT